MSEMTAEDHREAAKADRKRAIESFERCDTDGFLSQWASDLNARKHEREASILENGGLAEFWGLYEGDRRVKAKLVRVYNKFKFAEESKWVVEDDDPVCQRRKWIPSGKRSRIQKQLGLCERKEMAPAKACISGSGKGLSGTAWVATFRTGCKYGLDAKLVEGEG